MNFGCKIIILLVTVWIENIQSESECPAVVKDALIASANNTTIGSVMRFALMAEQLPGLSSSEGPQVKIFYFSPPANPTTYFSTKDGNIRKSDNMTEWEEVFEIVFQPKARQKLWFQIVEGKEMKLIGEVFTSVKELATGPRSQKLDIITRFPKLGKMIVSTIHDNVTDSESDERLILSVVTKRHNNKVLRLHRTIIVD